MSQVAKVARVVRWLRTVPGQLQGTHQAASVAQTQIIELRGTVEASSKAQLEAIRFLTRTVNELGDRLAKLESAGGDKAG